MLRPLRAARGQKPGVQLAAIDVHNHAMPLPLLEWFERTRLSATNTYRTRCLGFITSRRCIGWPRGDARGSFHSYSDARRGASPLRFPACRAGQQCVSPSNCRPGPRSSRSGSVFPRSRTTRPPRRAAATRALIAAASSRGDSCVTDSRTGTSGSSATSSSACRRPCPTNARQGRAVVVAILARQDLLSCRWLTIKQHLQVRVDGKSTIRTSVSNSYCHRHQVPPHPHCPWL